MTTKEALSSITPDTALQLLKEGNLRFSSGNIPRRNFAGELIESSKYPGPFAVVIACMDSRTSPELIMDQGLGDIFSIRVAANFIDEDVLGWIEFAAAIAGVKLVLVLGHNDCRAIGGACDNVELGSLTGFLKKLQPAVDSTRSTGVRDSSNQDFVADIAVTNVKLGLEFIKEKSAVLKELKENGKIKIAGGMYNTETGKIKFFEE